MMPHRIILGEELRLGCRYVGVPGPTVQFFQNDSILLMDGMDGVTIIGGAPSDNEITLVISSVGRMSGGTYTCRANNTVGMDEVVYSMTILGNYLHLGFRICTAVDQGGCVLYMCDRYMYMYVGTCTYVGSVGKLR